MADILTGLIDIGRDYLRTGVRVTLESNVLPPVTVYSGGSSSSTGGAVGLGKLLGIRAGIVVRNAQGKELARIGEPSSVEPLRLALLALAVAGAGYVVWRAVR